MREFLDFCNKMMVCCDNSIALPKKSKNYVDGQYMRPEKIQTYRSAKTKLDRCSRKVFRNFFMRDIGNVFGNFVKINPLVGFEELQSEVSTYVRRLLQSKKVTAEIPQASDPADFTKKLNEVFEKSGIAPRELWEEVGDKLTNMVMHGLNTKKDYSKMFDTLRKNVQNPDALITDDIKNYKTYEELGEEADTHPYAEKIEQLKRENADDPEYCKALDGANELLVSAKKDALTYSSDLCEAIPSAFHRIENERVANFVKNSKIYREKIKVQNKTVDYVGKDTAKDRIELAKALARENVAIPEKQRQAIKNIVAKIVDYKIFDPASYSLAGNSQRGFSKISELTRQLSDAVDGKDKERIISLQKELADVSTKMDEVLADLKKVDASMSMAANTASGRDGNRLAKYRMDVLGTSRLNTLWLLIANCHDAGMDVNDVIDHPMQGFSKLVEKQMIDNAPVNTFGRTHDLSEVINETTTNGAVFGKYVSENFAASDNLQRASEGLALIAGDPAIKTRLNALQSILSCSQIADATVFSQKALLFAYSQKQNMAEGIGNLMLVEPEDRNLIRLAPGIDEKIDYENFTVKKPFDREEYLKTKADLKRVAERITKVVNDYSETGKYAKSPVKAEVFTAATELVTSLKAIAKDESELETLQKLEAYVNERSPLPKPEVKKAEEVPTNVETKEKQEEVTAETVAPETVTEEKTQTVNEAPNKVPNEVQNKVQNEVRNEAPTEAPAEIPNEASDPEVPPIPRPSVVLLDGVGYGETRETVQSALEEIASTRLVGENGKRFCKMELLNFLNARHESRGFFSKLRFISNIRENNLIRSLKNELRVDGVSEEQLAEITDTGRAFHTEKWWNVTHGKPVAAEEPAPEVRKPEIGELIGEKVTAAAYPAIVKSLADIRKEYDRHGFMSKLFFPSVRAQKRNIDSLIQKISDDTGVGIAEIKQNVRQINSSGKFTAEAYTASIQMIIEDNEAIRRSDGNEAEKTAVFGNSEQYRANSEAEFRNKLDQTYGKNAGHTQNEVNAEVTGPVPHHTEEIRENENTMGERHA